MLPTMEPLQTENHVMAWLLQMAVKNSKQGGGRGGANHFAKYVEKIQANHANHADQRVLVFFNAPALGPRAHYLQKSVFCVATHERTELLVATARNKNIHTW